MPASNIDCFMLFTLHVDAKSCVSIKFCRIYLISCREKVRTRQDVTIIPDNIFDMSSCALRTPSKTDMHKDKDHVLIYIYIIHMPILMFIKSCGCDYHVMANNSFSH